MPYPWISPTSKWIHSGRILTMWCLQHCFLWSSLIPSLLWLQTWQMSSKLQSDDCYHCQWRWRRLVNAYELEASMVCLQCKNLCDPYLSTSEVSCSWWGAIQIYYHLYHFYHTTTTTTTNTINTHKTLNTVTSKSQLCTIITDWPNESTINTYTAMFHWFRCWFSKAHQKPWEIAELCFYKPDPFLRNVKALKEL